MERLSTFLVLTSLLAGCASFHAARIGAPSDPYLGPAETACAEAAKYEGSPDALAGQARAETNIAANHLVFVHYGTRIVMYPRPLFEVRYEKILASHGITFEEGDHSFPPWGEHYTYLCQLDKHIRQRFGEDFWERVDTQARM